ncbi:GNAT family N-acetyltransferase [Rothia aeria]|jgi:histone acetyltransferase HPA2/related acetyltransferase|uniref:GNAT family N-acetyltransferase n=1 Tax=Rothia aeria TaxID=172042 RepID=UPI00244B2BE6|nr:GNAT family N-acetyltransferase [Rothia aeria]MDK7677513.1 GNAT family N-acetyltransferase [Rothia aeria]
MPDALTIRPAAPNDAQEVARIRVLGWRFAYQGLVPQGYLDSLNVAEDTERMHGYLSQLPQNLPPNKSAPGLNSGDSGKRSFMLATRGDAVLGFCHFSAAPNNADRLERATPGGEMVGRLHSLYIDPGALGQGIGHTLMSQALSTFTAWGCKRAHLWVLEGNSRAISFYERQGWQLTGDTKVDRSFGPELHEQEMAICL